MTNRVGLLAVMIGAWWMMTASAWGQEQHRYWVFIGCGSNDGIGLYELDADAGTLTAMGSAAAARSPGFLAITPDQKFLYATVNLKNNAGGVAGFAIDPVTGKLTEINNQPSGGDGPAFVSVDPAGKNVLVANYGSATVASLPIDAKGALSPVVSVIKQVGSSIDPQRQKHAYAHSINCDPSGKFAIACDLGADKVFVYKLDPETGKLIENDPASVSVPPGAGPRHLTFSADGKLVYLLNEMGGTVIEYGFDPEKGTLAELQTVKTLKDDEKGSTAAEVQIDPTGRFLYASNRLTTNYLTIFSIDRETGKLTLVGYQDCLGKTPRNFRIDPSGKYLLLANQDSNTLVLFAIDNATGKLSAVGDPIHTLHAPMCVKFVPVQK
jgi:6-phosphogluconolactonase